MIVGQSLCGPCVETGVPFTGGCESLLLEGLGAAGKVKKDVFITNVVHCHPPGNLRSRRDEKANCAQFLDRELAMVRPRLIVALGNDARDALTDKCRGSRSVRLTAPGSRQRPCAAAPNAPGAHAAVAQVGMWGVGGGPRRRCAMGLPLGGDPWTGAGGPGDTRIRPARLDVGPPRLRQQPLRRVSGHAARRSEPTSDWTAVVAFRFPGSCAPKPTHRAV